MKCPNCKSSRVRRAKRTIGEKIFLSMLLARPFRCEDCIHRYFGFLLASGSNLAGVVPDAKSLVYRSATAALHSADRKHRGAKRKVYSDGSKHPSGVIAAPAFTSIGKPIQQPEWQPLWQPLRQRNVQGYPPPMRENSRTSKTMSESFPEILGVIMEIKHQTV